MKCKGQIGRRWSRDESREALLHMQRLALKKGLTLSARWRSGCRGGHAHCRPPPILIPPCWTVSIATSAPPILLPPVPSLLHACNPTMNRMREQSFGKKQLNVAEVGGNQLRDVIFCSAPHYYDTLQLCIILPLYRKFWECGGGGRTSGIFSRL